MLRRLISSIVMVSMVVSSVMWQTVAVAAPLSMTQIYSYAKAGNLKALQSLKQTGNSLETIDKYGNTALCRSIWMKDYASFFVLKKAGASTASMCVSKIPAEQIQSFNANYTAWAEGVNSGKIAYPVKSAAQFTATPNGAVAPSQTTAATTGTQTSMLVEPIATTTGLSVGAKVAIGVGALAAIGGGVALAAGGGGGGGSSGGSSEPDTPIAPDNGSGDGDEGGDDEPDTPTPPVVDLCANVDCGDHGECNASTGACDCDVGYSGASCQIAPDNGGEGGECKNGYSMHNGVCKKIVLDCMTQDEDECIACDTDYTLYNNLCYLTLECGINQHQEAGQCVCNLGFVRNVDGECVLNNNLSFSTSPTSNISGSLSIFQEGVDTGYQTYILPKGEINSTGSWFVPPEIGGDVEDPMLIGSYFLINTGDGIPNLVIPKETTLNYTSNVHFGDDYVGAITAFGGAIYNYGTVNSDNFGIYADTSVDVGDNLGGGLYLINEGIIHAKAGGVFVRYGDVFQDPFYPSYIWNKSDGIISADIAVEGSGMFFRNDGNIIGKSAGVSLSGSTFVNNGTVVVNTDGSGFGDGLANAGVGGFDSSIINTANGKIIVQGSSSDFGGMYGHGVMISGNSVFYNYGTIEVSNFAVKEIWVGDTIALQFGGAIVAHGPNARVYNTGTIKVSNIYWTKIVADEEGNERVVGQSIISDASPIIYLLNGAQLLTSGVIEMDDAISLSSMNGKVIALPNAQFISPMSITDDLILSTEFVTNNFNTTVVAENMIQTPDTTRLNLVSESILFDASLADNGADVVLTKKLFSDVMSDQSVATFLENNYAQGNNEALFNSLKAAPTTQALSTAWARASGTDTLANFAYEDFAALRSLNHTMNDALFTKKGDIRSMVGYDHLYQHRDSKAGLTGYSSNADSTYALTDRAFNDFRFGLGMAVTRYNSDYKNDSDRTETVYQAFAPIGFEKAGFKFVSVPRIGYANGHYTRTTDASSAKGKTEKWLYGLTNEVRYPMTIAGLTIEPAAEFNILGWHTKGHSEDNAVIRAAFKSDNQTSVEAGLGLYLRKEMNIGESSRLNMRAGGAWYYEMAKPYGQKMSLEGMTGDYRMEDWMLGRHRGQVSGEIGYDYKNIGLYAKFTQFIENDTRFNMNAGIRVGF